jgi:hypothetical protein
VPSYQRARYLLALGQRQRQSETTSQCRLYSACLRQNYLYR